MGMAESAVISLDITAAQEEEVKAPTGLVDGSETETRRIS